jgi:DNA repair ATPase RecN
MDEIPGEFAARLAALETKVAELYRQLDLVEPSGAEAVAESIPTDIQHLARSGQRQEAIRAVIERFGVSTVDASARVNGYLRSIGH